MGDAPAEITPIDGADQVESEGNIGLEEDAIDPNARDNGLDSSLDMSVENGDTLTGKERYSPLVRHSLNIFPRERTFTHFCRVLKAHLDQHVNVCCVAGIKGQWSRESVPKLIAEFVANGAGGLVLVVSSAALLPREAEVLVDVHAMLCRTPSARRA